MKKSSYKCPKTRLLIFYFSHFKSAAIFIRKTTLGTLLGFSFKMADKVADLKMTCYHFLKKYKTNLTFPSDTNIVYRYVLLVYSIIFAGQPLFTNFILLRSEDKDAIF